MASEEFRQLLVRLEAAQAAAPPLGDRPDFGAMRTAMEGRAFPVSPGTDVHPVEVDGVRGEWVCWPSADTSRRLLLLHGGGYVMGSPAAHRELAGRLSRASGCAVLVLDYRLAPEAPFPAAVDDAVHALAWMRDHGPEGTSVASSMAVAGDSAGGGLALATLINVRDRGLPLPRAGLLMSPWADMLASGESYVRFGAGNIHTMADAYLAGADPRHPLASPVYATLAGLPPLMIQVGEAEAFLDDSTVLASRAREAGVDVTLEVWPEMIHVFQAYAPVIPEGQEAIDRAGAFLRRHLTVPELAST
ncbi:MAG: alpha/beta hydrolase [Dehalococcoidia bacterium]